ncbi:MAG: B12-binding domain-containing radical SAM protein [Gammaproteobacteria bacterium]|nr:B12-binding domain-containing radical SAM protein [Gammaproteobacteria bacterium]MBT4493627.1 B12-binding domain-containing radical SAM protein [Gammaproteobacteria bacterium]MBT7370101.1 B12-binding domain-containing radical SAM protein [Gammaproteobacteria bacterium]
MHISFDSFLNPQHNSRNFKKSDGKIYNSLSTDLPLGPISISAYLKKHMDIEVRLIDFNAEINSLDAFPYSNFHECCIDFLKKTDWIPDFVGVSSLFSPSFHNFMDCGRAARSAFPDAIVIGGGNIPTNSFEHIYKELDCEFYDGLCYGEGEKPMRALLQADEPREYLDQSTSWVTKNSLADAAFQPEHDYIVDLDEIPFFDYELCDFEKHASNQVAGSSFHNIEDKRGFHVMTSRGCPYRCTFCASHKTHGRDMRFHSLDRVREDLTKLVENYSAGTIVFQDDHFMSDKDRVLEILEIVKELGVESLYQNGLTLYALDKPMLQAFHDAGVRHLVLPVESGSEKVLKHQMRKPLKLRISEQVARDCRDLGIYTNSNVLIGMPGETKEDLDDGRRNLRRVVTNWYNIACASPIVGSEMHEIAKKNDYIQRNTMGADYRTAVIATEDFTPDYIQQYQYRMNLELNFVGNNDMRFGDYDTALLGFLNVIRLRDDHAFAHFFASKCFAAIGETEKAQHHRQAYLQFAGNDFWTPWVEFFALPDSDESFDDWQPSENEELAVAG